MSLLLYLFYCLTVVLMDLLGILTGYNLSLFYLLAAVALLVGNGIRKFFADRSGNGFRDSKKAEMLDNSVTKPANFKHEFIYNDCSGKTLLFIELPFILSIIVNLILQRFFGIF